MMTEKRNQILSIAGSDFTRFVLMLAVAALLFWLQKWLPVAVGEPALAPLLSSVAILVSLCLASHLVRRIFFPMLDLMKFAITASETPLGASIVFASVCYVLVTLINANVAMMR